MLSRLFKPAWQSDSPEKRLLAIQKLNRDDKAHQLIFEELASKDRSDAVRIECIKQMDNAESLFIAYQAQTKEATKETAKSAFCETIGNKSTLDEAEIESLVLRHNDSKILIAQHCPYPELRVRLVASLEETVRAQIVADVYYADTRLYIAESLITSEALEIGRKQLKGKDKNAERVIRAKLDALRIKQKLETNVNTLANELCEQMEFIAQHPEWRPEFKSKYELYQQRWSALELEPPLNTIQRFTDSAKTAESKVEHQTTLEQAENQQLSVSGKLEQYCVTLATLSLSELSEEQLSINTVLGEALTSWLESTSVIPAREKISTQFLNAQQALSSLSDLIETASSNDINVKELASNIASLSWQKHYPPLVARAEADTLLHSIKTQELTLKEQEKRNLDSLHKRINRLLGTSNKGDLKKAKHELSATTKAATKYAGKERKILDERLEMANEIVLKMTDWQDFAIEPKLIELCDSMESLIGSKVHPDKLANQISGLQKKWKTLGHGEISEQHWPRFKRASDTAYEPCSEFFSQRRATQKANLAKREPIIEQTRTLLNETNWNDSPDYKLVEATLRQISNDWRKIKDVDRKAGQKQWDKLSAIKELIYQKIDPVYDANIEQKHQLIEQTRSLAESSIGDDSISKLQLFQNRWKQIGITRRKQDQEAWKQFRDASESVYQRVKAQRNEKRAIEDEQISAYKNIIGEIYSLAKSAQDLSKSDLEFDTLCEKYKSLPPIPKALPEKLTDKLEKDFQRACETYSKAHDRIVQASKDKVIDKLREKAALCTKLELAIKDNKRDQALELERTIDAITIDEKSLAKRFEERLKASALTDKTKANEARRLVCIDLEILLGQPSPEQDKALRMQVQLERMKDAGIGHSSIELSNALNNLKLDWLCLPGAEPDLQDTLEQRFNALIANN